MKDTDILSGTGRVQDRVRQGSQVRRENAQLSFNVATGQLPENAPNSQQSDGVR